MMIVLAREKVLAEAEKNKKPVKNKYDKEPVYYCSGCLSLNIRGVEDCEYCDVCGSTNVEKCSIEEWENLYYNRYNKHYIENQIKNNYGRE